MRVSVLICTKDRPMECLRAIESACEQTVCPFEIVLVDACSNSDLEMLVKGIGGSYGVDIHYITTRPQLTYQRNVAAAAMGGDVGLFIDDDVILDRHYIEEIVRVYADEPNVGGVAGCVTNVGAPVSTMFFRKMFLLWHRYGDGKMQRSGYPTYLYNAKEPQQVDVFEGCNMSYRREVLDTFSFDERMKFNHAFEDHDFSYRVSRRYKLIQTPFAQLAHVHSSSGRKDLAYRWESATYWHYSFFKKNMPRTWISVAAYLWSDIGNIFVGVKSCLGRRSGEPMKGLLKGYVRIYKELLG